MVSNGTSLYRSMTSIYFIHPCAQLSAIRLVLARNARFFKGPTDNDNLPNPVGNRDNSQPVGVSRRKRTKAGAKNFLLSIKLGLVSRELLWVGWDASLKS